MNTIKAVLCFVIIANVLSLHAFLGATTVMPLLKSAVSEAGPEAKIVGAAMGLSTLYAIAHCQVIARFCPHFFTKGKLAQEVKTCPDDWLRRSLLNKKSPTKMGFLWGLSSFMLGMIPGIPIALASRVGASPKLSVSDLLKPTGIAFAGTALASIVSGLAYYACLRKVDVAAIKRNFENEVVDVPDRSIKRYVTSGFASIIPAMSYYLSGAGITAWILHARGII